MLNIYKSQTGLAYFPNYAIYSTYYIKGHDKAHYNLWQKLAQQIDQVCKSKSYRTVVILGVGFELWEAWSKELKYTLPKGMGSKETLDQYAQFLGNSGGDLWFHIKSDDAAEVEALSQLIQQTLDPILSQPSQLVPAEKRYNGKVLGGRFIDGLENPADLEDLSRRVIIGEEDPTHTGGAFLISQKFVHDWDKLNAMSELQKQNMIGRDREDRLVPMEDPSSHIKRVRQLDQERINFRLVRQALPYGRHKDNKAHEKGIFFAGYAKGHPCFRQNSFRNSGSSQGLCPGPTVQ